MNIVEAYETVLNYTKNVKMNIPPSHVIRFLEGRKLTFKVTSNAPPIENIVQEFDKYSDIISVEYSHFYSPEDINKLFPQVIIHFTPLGKINFSNLEKVQKLEEVLDKISEKDYLYIPRSALL